MAEGEYREPQNVQAGSHVVEAIVDQALHLLHVRQTPDIVVQLVA